MGCIWLILWYVELDNFFVRVLEKLKARKNSFKIFRLLKDKLEIGRIILLKIKTKSGTNGSAITWKALVSYFHQVQNRFSISYIFSTPKNWSDLEFHCSFEVLYVVWNKFPDRKEIVIFWKKKIPFGTTIFLIFPHKKTGKA